MNDLIVANQDRQALKRNLKFEGRLLEGLSREGLLSVENGTETHLLPHHRPIRPMAQRADLLIQGTAKQWKMDLPDPLFVYVRWCSDLQVIEQAKQRIIGIVSRSGREGHITLHEANARASKVMQAAVTTDVAQALSIFIYGDSEELSAPSKTACPR